MDKTLQDLAWSCLPKEFKEEVKKYYRILHEQHKEYDRLHFDNARAKVQERIVTLECFFGHHNLTSDAEGEEMLCVKREWVQEMYKNNCDEIRRENISSSDKDCYEYANEVLKTLFGSKCLPDNVATYEPNVYSSVGSVESLDPKPAEPKNEYFERLHAESVQESRIASEESYLRNLSQNIADCDKQFNTIIKDSFRNERRLNIATQILSGILSNQKMLNNLASGEITADGAIKCIVDATIMYTDALIARTQKGSDDGED